MSWKKIAMKFPGTCIICNEKILVNEIGLWAKDLGVKHERCAQTSELQCIVCNGPAGCPQCEFQESCDIPNVSEFCICKGCSGKQDSFDSYQKSASKRFPALNS